MIQSFRIINDAGESIDLDIHKPEETGFLVTSVIGLTYPSADISVAEYAAFDGALFGNRRIPQRNILMQLIFYLENRQKLSVEELRLKCDRIFPVKKHIKFYVTNDSGTYWIEGYIEKNDVNIFSKEEGASISIICDDPYFTKENEELIAPVSKITGRFSFPCSFEFVRDGAAIWIKYILDTVETEYGKVGTISGINEEDQPVDISIADMPLTINDAGGLELNIPPEDIY